MTELEATTQLLGRLVNHSLHSSFAGEHHTDEHDTDEDEEPALPVGQYL